MKIRLDLIVKLSKDSTLRMIYVFRPIIKFSNMRIFISFAIITILSVKITAGDDDDKYADCFIDPGLIMGFQILKESRTPAELSAGIPNAERFQQFFQRLSNNFMEACKTVENAQFFVAAVQPSEIVKVFNTIITEFDQTYQGHPFRLIMKNDVITTKNQLNEYGDEIAPFTWVQSNWFNGFTVLEWTQQHRNDFENVGIGKKLADYLKHVNDLIYCIQKSIAKSRRKIEDRQLKRLGTKILRGVERFLKLVAEVDYVSSSLVEIRNAIDGLRNTNNGKYFNDMKTNARKILNDLDQLKLLMEKQWTHMDYIFRNRQLPEQLPTVTLAN